MSIHEALQYRTLDEVAECFDGVPTALYQKLWSLMPDKPAEPDGPAQEWPEPDSPDRALVSRHWHQFTTEEQATLNELARRNDRGG